MLQCINNIKNEIPTSNIILPTLLVGLYWKVHAPIHWDLHIKLELEIFINEKKRRGYMIKISLLPLRVNSKQQKIKIMKIKVVKVMESKFNQKV